MSWASILKRKHKTTVGFAHTRSELNNEVFRPSIRRLDIAPLRTILGGSYGIMGSCLGFKRKPKYDLPSDPYLR